MTAPTGHPGREADAMPTRRLHLVPAEPAGATCFRCERPAVEHVQLPVTHPTQPPRPPVALCAIHRDRHTSGAAGIGWCERGAHPGLSATYCDVHHGTIT